MRTQVMDDLIKLFAENPIWTLQEMAEHLHYSEVSVRRFLKRIGYLRSYTHNGKFYTLQRMAQFNSHGIWRHEQRGFSKHGTLVQTINHLIHKSPMGLSAAELTGILESPCQLFFSNHYKAGKLDRIKPGPEYVYPKHQGRGYGFPFDRVHVDFTHRLYYLQAYVKHFKRAAFQDARVLRPLNQLMGDLVDLSDDNTLKKAMREIDGKIQVFETLRTAMRIAPTDGKDGLNCNGMDVNLKTIEKRVNRFCKHLKSDQPRYDRPEYQKMIGQIETYWDKLFADPITVATDKGKVTIVPQRTNNIMEQLFRDHKKSHCRKTGNGRMNKALQTVLADTPLVKNLENDPYMTLLLDGKGNLEEVFAEIDVKMVRDELAKAQQDFNKIPVKLRKIISRPELPEMVAEMQRVPKMAKIG